MPALPTGVITLVFTDIEGSSVLWEAHRHLFAPVLAEHNRVLRAVAAARNGVEVKTEGDAFFLVFARAADAVCFAVDTQRALAAHDWNTLLPGLDAIRVRIGMHSGEPILGDHPDGTSDYFGPVVNRAARVGGAGHGGQIVISDATRVLSLRELPADVTVTELGQHTLKGVGEETLWQVGHPELPSRFPPLKAAALDKHNLPAQTTPFVGRAAEIAEWSALLRDSEVRLLTLLGFGGQGKTRLALQIAENLVEDFADGVWWIELEEARHADAMIARIAHELRIHLHPQPTVREQVFNFHRDRQLLLVLDNTEQIADAGLVVNELLSAGPNIKCLVTTRRALEIRAERRVQVPPLPPSDAVALFVERAQSQVADFSLTPESRREVEELCRSLEGVPLAIELAASRSGVLSPGEMLGRLDERFRLLQRRAPDLPPRQRALRGAIDWSYELLSPDDQQLLTELSVFVGGFLIEAAEAVCADFDVLEGVAELHRHSLLRSESTGGKTRFWMQESVRAYAGEKLAEAEGADALRKRHAAYYLRFAEARNGKLRSRQEAAALRELLSERANAQAALNWARESGDAGLAARLALALHESFYRLGLWHEVQSMLQGAYEALPPGSEPGLRTALQLHLASLAHDRGESAVAQSGAEMALESARASGDTGAQAKTLNLLGLLATDRGESEAAASLFQQSLALRAEDHTGRAIALHNLARLASRREDLPAARSLYEEALTHRQAGGDARGEAETLGNLGVVEQKAGNAAAARAMYLQSLRLRRELQDPMGTALMLHNLAELAEDAGDDARAITLFVHAARLFQRLDSSFEEAPIASLQAIQTRLGETCAPLREQAEGSSWEALVDTADAAG